MPLELGKLWVRLTGLKEWDREVELLKNVKGDGSPAQGPEPIRDAPSSTQDEAPLNAEQRRQRYEVWDGEDPGH